MPAAGHRGVPASSGRANAANASERIVCGMVREDDADRNASSGALTSDRLANLSDGMFSVAMTLLATTLILPVQSLTGSAFNMLHDIGGALSSVVLSFAISSTYWLSERRQLTMSSVVTPRQTVLHFVFLFLIVLLPISTALSGRGAAVPVVLIYGTHLVLLALVNLLLWGEVHRKPLAQIRIPGAFLTLASFLAALAIGVVRPDLAQYFWYAGFAMPWLGRRFTWRRRGTVATESVVPIVLEAPEGQ
jgi:uncharacterized membrane protein